MAKLETKIYDARISDLTETEHNPRQISKKDFAKLKKSLKEFPEMLDIREVVIDENNVILGGHQRVKAALANGDETIPVKQVFGLTDEQKRQFVIKDNIANGDWDWDELANHWDDLDLDGWGLETDWTPKSEKEYDNDDPDTGGLVRKFGAPPLSVFERRPFRGICCGRGSRQQTGGGVSRIHPRHHRRVCGSGVSVLQRNYIGQFGINRGNAGVPPIQCVAQGLQGPPKRACILQRESKKYQKQFP